MFWLETIIFVTINVSGNDPEVFCYGFTLTNSETHSCSVVSDFAAFSPVLPLTTIPSTSQKEGLVHFHGLPLTGHVAWRRGLF